MFLLGFTPNALEAAMKSRKIKNLIEKLVIPGRTSPPGNDLNLGDGCEWFLGGQSLFWLSGGSMAETHRMQQQSPATRR